MIKTRGSLGFTLIELLIVVALIAILSGIVIKVVDVGGVRSKSRDSQRISDLRKIQLALELYFADMRVYPTTGNLDDLESGYLNNLPQDPLDSSSYLYESTGGTGYTLVAEVEISSSGNGVCGSSGVPPCYGVADPYGP